MTSREHAPHNRVLRERFRLLYKLGAGGMGSVWLADDQLLNRPVALKELALDNGPENPAVARKRAEQEAKALARVRHPVIVSVHDLFYEGREPWIVMEYINGRSLDSLIREGPVDDETAARIGLQVARGLKSVHKADVVHRDVKPENILRTDDGAIFLVDFGIAWIAGGQPLTRVNSVVGTPQYVAPERIKGSRTEGPPTDLWSLGVTLYFAITGRRPFRDAKSEYPVLHERPQEIGRPSVLTDLILRLLDKNPDTRADDAEAIRELTAALRGRKRPSLQAWEPPDPAARVARQAVPPPQGTPHPVSRPNLATEPPNGRDYMRARIEDVRGLITGVGPETGATMLLAIPHGEAASILDRLPTVERVKLLQGVADIRPADAAAILLRLDPDRVSRVADGLRADAAAAILARLPVDKAAPIVAGMDERRAGRFVRHLPGPYALALLRALGNQRAAGVVTHAKLTAAAEVLRPDPAFATAVLRQLNANDRQVLAKMLASGCGTGGGTPPDSGDAQVLASS